MTTTTWTTDEDFLARICEDGDDALPRMKYADYLDERSRTAEAAFWREAAGKGWKPFSLRHDFAKYSWWKLSVYGVSGDHSSVPDDLVQSMKRDQENPPPWGASYVPFFTKEAAWAALRNAWIAVRYEK